MNEPFVKIDLHGLRQEEAVKVIDKAIASVGPATYQLQLIHGYNRGTSLRSMIQDAVQSATLSLSGDQPLINIEEMSVRSDDDIRKISQQLNTLLTAGRRAKGYI